jgi:hypothetical protein
MATDKSAVQRVPMVASTPIAPMVAAATSTAHTAIRTEAHHLVDKSVSTHALTVSYAVHYFYNTLHASQHICQDLTALRHACGAIACSCQAWPTSLAPSRVSSHVVRSNVTHHSRQDCLAICSSAGYAAISS